MNWGNNNNLYTISDHYFFNLLFFVINGVYIPKFETEYIIYLFQKEINNENILNVVDVCGGTGCIAITIKKLFPLKEVWILEKNILAIQNILININYHNVQINLIKEDVFKIKTINSENTLIICNPPYIKTKDVEKITNKNNLLHNLDGGYDGLKYVKYILKHFKDKYFIFELGYNTQVKYIYKKYQEEFYIISHKPIDNMDVFFVFLIRKSKYLHYLPLNDN
ncbi:50S ribosomal protein L3 glutamine methyltransferase [bacterium AB1]|nr:50S ribosomal protein L3 glutamine methyltransferase [bacterium AB1]